MSSITSPCFIAECWFSSSTNISSHLDFIKGFSQNKTRLDFIVSGYFFFLAFWLC